LFHLFLPPPVHEGHHREHVLGDERGARLGFERVVAVAECQQGIGRALKVERGGV
jgi:hypothetical protein